MLPKEKSKPKQNLFDYVIFIHGAPKIGKSTFVSEIDKVLFADTEGGLSALSVYREPVSSWANGSGSFLNLCKEFTTEEHDYSCLCIDTADILHKLCQNYIMIKNNIQHPSDLDWGKAWMLVKDEFLRPLVKLAVSPYGLILISHTKEIEIKTRIATITKAVPSMQNYIWTQMEGFVDIILYFTSIITEDGEKRVIKTAPSENWIAGDRTRRLLRVQEIDMNWNALKKVFENK